MSAQIEELQFLVGEGPCVDAYRQNRPVLEPDLDDPESFRWAGFTPLAVDAGVRAPFSVPLKVGELKFGALNLYRDKAGPLDSDQHADALAVADVAINAVLTAQGNAAADCVADEIGRGVTTRSVCASSCGDGVGSARHQRWRSARSLTGSCLWQRTPPGRSSERDRRPATPIRLNRGSSGHYRGPATSGWAFPSPLTKQMSPKGCSMITESLLAATLVELADCLVDDFDIVELLTLLSDRCVELLDVQAAGVMLGAAGGELRVLASSSAAMRGLELFEEQSEEGPCQDCYVTGQPVVNATLIHDDRRWPRFTTRALAAGFQSVHALPMHLRDLTIGALNLFRADEGELGTRELTVAQAFADMATVTILQHRARYEAERLNEQLSQALNTRISIEQAKGVLSQRTGLTTDQAFIQLRSQAAERRVRLGDHARDIISGSVTAASIIEAHK